MVKYTPWIDTMVRIGYIDTVHGICPHCDEDTLLVAIVTDYYKCTHVVMKLDNMLMDLLNI